MTCVLHAAERMDAPPTSSSNHSSSKAEGEDEGEDEARPAAPAAAAASSAGGSRTQFTHSTFVPSCTSTSHVGGRRSTGESNVVFLRSIPCSASRRELEEILSQVSGVYLRLRAFLLCLPILVERGQCS